MTRGMQSGRQTTLRKQVAVSRIGIHSGSPVTVTLHPAEADTGVVFWRTGNDGQRDRELAAHFRSVTATEFSTVLGDRNGPAVSTTEHVLAAIYGLGLDNVVVEVDGPEVPIMDGSAAPFVAAIDRAGIVTMWAAPLYQGAQAGPGQRRRLLWRIAAASLWACGSKPKSNSIIR